MTVLSSRSQTSRHYRNEHERAAAAMELLALALPAVRIALCWLQDHVDVWLDAALSPNLAESGVPVLAFWGALAELCTAAHHALLDSMCGVSERPGHTLCVMMRA